METATLVPQQEQTTEENAPALRPWSTPRLQRLNQASRDTEKNPSLSEIFDCNPLCVLMGPS